MPLHPEVHRSREFKDKQVLGFGGVRIPYTYGGLPRSFKKLVENGMTRTSYFSAKKQIYKYFFSQNTIFVF